MRRFPTENPGQLSLEINSLCSVGRWRRYIRRADFPFLSIPTNIPIPTGMLRLDIGKGSSDMGQKARRSKLYRALDEAYRHRRAPVFAITSRGGGEDSADLIHDAFLCAFEAGLKAEIRSPFGLVLRVARNKVVDRWRAKQRWASIMEESEHDGYSVDPSPDAERTLMASERLQRALDCIASMPPRRREVFLLHRFDGLTYSKIAQKLAISPRTVEDHISSAIFDLSRAMDVLDEPRD